MDWKDLFDHGTLVRLNIGVWSGLVKVKPQDIGLPDTPEVREVLTLGHERLVAKDKIDKLRGLGYDARKAVEDCGLDFPLVVGARFVPRERRGKLIERLEHIQTVFEAARIKFANNYETYKQEMLPKIRKALMDANDGDEKVVQAAMDRITSKYPSAAEVECKFYFRYKCIAISAPTDGAVQDELNNIEEDVKDAIRAMMGSLREEVVEKVNHILDMLKRGAKFTGKTLRSARDLFKKINSLNIFGDKELAEAVKKFEAILVDIDPESEQVPPSLESLKSTLAGDLESAIQKATDKLALGKRKLK